MSHARRLDLDHKLRLHPDYVLASLVRRQFDRPLCGTQWLQLLEKLARCLVTVASPHATGIAEFAVLMQGDRKGANGVRERRRRRITDNNDLLTAAAFYLDKVV